MIRRQGRVSSSRVLPDPLAFAPLTATSSRIYVFGMSTGFRAGKEAVSIFETVR